MFQMIYDEGLEWHIYEYRLKRWQLKGYFLRTQEDRFKYYLQSHGKTIKWLLIGLDMARIELIYEIAPEMKIIIWPDSLFKLISYHPIWGVAGEEEIASTLEMKVKEEQEEAAYFLMRFYHTTSRYEANRVYEKWQYTRNLSSEIGNKVADIFQIYEEEIFNYFRYRAILRAWKQKVIENVE